MSGNLPRDTALNWLLLALPNPYVGHLHIVIGGLVATDQLGPANFSSSRKTVLIVKSLEEGADDAYNRKRRLRALWRRLVRPELTQYRPDKTSAMLLLGLMTGLTRQKVRRLEKPPFEMRRAVSCPPLSLLIWDICCGAIQNKLRRAVKYRLIQLAGGPLSNRLLKNNINSSRYRRELVAPEPQTLDEIRSTGFLKCFTPADKMFKWTHIGKETLSLSLDPRGQRRTVLPVDPLE